MLLTATPTMSVLPASKKVLGLGQVEVIQENLDRPEIFLEVRTVRVSFYLSIRKRPKVKP